MNRTNGQTSLASLDQGFSATVPPIWWTEVINAALTGERRGRTTREKVDGLLKTLSRLPILPDQSTEKVQVLNLARQNNLSAYDASYLELALRLNADLASLDQPLLAAAKSAGVKRFEP
jgi:predicted nucleic acid-binding protein